MLHRLRGARILLPGTVYSYPTVDLAAKVMASAIPLEPISKIQDFNLTAVPAGQIKAPYLLLWKIEQLYVQVILCLG